MLSKPILFALCALPLSVAAADSLEIGLGDSLQIRLPADAAQITLSSPAVADVTLQSPRLLVLFGKYPGGTRLQVTDAAHHLLLERRVLVTAASADGVTLRYGTGKNWVAGGANVATECDNRVCTPALTAPSDSPFKTPSSTAAIAPK